MGSAYINPSRRIPTHARGRRLSPSPSENPQRRKRGAAPIGSQTAMPLLYPTDNPKGRNVSSAIGYTDTVPLSYSPEFTFADAPAARFPYASATPASAGNASILRQIRTRIFPLRLGARLIGLFPHGYARFAVPRVAQCRHPESKECDLSSPAFCDHALR